jgi:2-phosphosulfolactate phosphatase
MNIEVFFSPVVGQEVAVEGRTAVVIDVIRATSCMVEAMANGARTIFPTVSAENAIKLASDLGREDTLLCGERKGVMIEGFDLGNSPSEFTIEVVEGKQLVMSTTNGTRAFLAVESAERVLAASFLNISAVAQALSDVSDLVVVCAGRANRFSLDDALCAGHLITKVLDGRKSEPLLDVEPELNDGARMVLDLAEKYEPTEEFLRSTLSGKALQEVGFDSDLALCATLDKHTVVPQMKERRIELGKVK